MINEAVDTIQAAYYDVWRAWPLLLIRLGQQILLAFVLVGSLFVTLVPLVVGGIVALSDFKGDPAEFLRSLLLDHPLLIAYAFAAVLVAGTLAMLVYAFFQAGLTGAYEEVLRTGELSSVVDRFLRYARESWWRTFWIFQWIWGIIGLIFALPMLAVALVVLVWRDSVAVLVAGCLFLALLFLVMLVVSFFATGWSAVSVVLGVTRRLPAKTAVRDGWLLYRRRAGSFVLVMLILLVISIVIGAAVASLSFGLGMGSSVRYISLLLMPVQISVSILHMLVSVYVSCWFVAALVRVTMKEVRSGY